MRIGMFGGTFDPPHRGHLVIAEDVRRLIPLDEVIFVPSATPPHKQGRVMTPAGERLAMVSLAVGGLPGFSVSDLEIRRGGVSYTVDTVRELHREHPSAELFVLIGVDNLDDFWNWKDPEEILKLAGIIAMTRPGVDAPPPERLAGRNIQVVEVTPDDAASREIRRMVAAGLPVDDLVPPAVARYIREHDLYRASA